MLASLLAVAAVAFIVEWLGARLMSRPWRRARWVVLPGLGATVAHFVPLGVFRASPAMDAGLSTALGLTLPLLFALHGLFLETFWSGPTEADIAATGMRSVLQRRQRSEHPVRRL